VPASQTLPSSFYLPSKPSWFGSVAWPAIGPDVTGGNISGYAGHANKIPARVCYEGAALDPAYPSSNPRVRLIDPATCYAAVIDVKPNPPSNVILTRVFWVNP
jgi:hypothetical protein